MKISPHKIPVKKNRIIVLVLHYLIKTGFSIYRCLSLKFRYKKKKLLTNEINKILIIRIDGLGDVAMSTPAFRALRNIFSNAHITLLTANWSKELVEVMPTFDEIIYFDAPWMIKERKGRIKNLIRTIRKLQKAKFDLSIDLRGDFRNNMLMYFISNKNRLGFDITGFDFFLTEIIPCGSNHHAVTLCLSLIRYLDPNYEGKLELKLWTTEADREFAEKFLKQNNIGYGEIVVIIHPGAKWIGRRWKTENFTQLADIIIEKYDAKVIIAGSPDDIDLVKNIKNLMKHVPVVTNNDFPLRCFLALLSYGDLFIGVDSGPMHMAAAMGTKVIAILGPARSEAIGPYGNEHIVVTKQENYSCSPCAQIVCNVPDDNCMDAITIEDVWSAVETQLTKILSQKDI